MLTYAEFAKRHGFTRGTVTRWAHEGMPVERFGRLARITDESAALAWVRGLAPRPNTRQHRRSRIYFARRISDGAIKIGWTVDVARRAQWELKKNYGGDDFEILTTLPGTKRTEAAFHRAFAEDANERELFRPSEALLAFVSMLAERKAA